MTLSRNSLALLLLCSQLGLDDDSAKSLTLREWNPLVRKMQAASLRPADLLFLSVEDLQTRLDLPADYASRITNLTSQLRH